MRFTVSKKHLISALKAVTPAVPTRPGLPALACVRIDASGNLLSLKATDLELAIEEFVATEQAVERPGAALVPAKMLAKALQAMGADEVTLEATSDPDRPRLKVSAGARTIALDAYAEGEWPAFPSHERSARVADVEASALRDALERAAVCASTDEARPILTAVALFIEKGSPMLQVVATDSYRLGVVEVPLAGEPDAPERPMLVPASVAKALARRLKGERGRVTILRDEDPGGRDQRAVFSFARTDWWVRTIEGEFPNWHQVMPEAEGGRLDADAKELESALKAASTVRGGDSAPVQLSLDATCTLRLDEPDVGRLTEELDGARFSPDGVGPLDVAYNPEYLLDGVRFVGTERIRMWVRDGLKPALIEARGRRYAVMPVRTR
jgi:DNA polymerase-3 subunit beta